MRGPAIIESETTTVVIEPEVTFELRPSGTLHISFDASGAQLAATTARAKEA
jgi:hypothetical protein